MSQRLQKYLASAGLGSRRACEDLIREGRVRVNGQIAQLGASVDPDQDVVEVDGHNVRPQPLEYWLLNKPAGVVTTASDPQGRQTVLRYVPARSRVYPVGRLDFDTTGVLLLTNDGELTNRLLHPRFGVSKEYEVVVRGRLGSTEKHELERGVVLEDGPTAPAQVRIVDVPGQETRLAITIHEGRKRQIKRMMEAVGHPVIKLHRTRFGPLTDRGLAPGEARPLRRREIERLWEAGRGPKE
ncbi:MAG: pseudouridine synthase [Thermoleophilia bacterium]